MLTLESKRNEDVNFFFLGPCSPNLNSEHQNMYVLSVRFFTVYSSSFFSTVLDENDFAEVDFAPRMNQFPHTPLVSQVTPQISSLFAA